MGEYTGLGDGEAGVCCKGLNENEDRQRRLSLDYSRVKISKVEEIKGKVLMLSSHLNAFRDITQLVNTALALIFIPSI